MSKYRTALVIFVGLLLLQPGCRSVKPQPQPMGKVETSKRHTAKAVTANATSKTVRSKVSPPTAKVKPVAKKTVPISVPKSPPGKSRPVKKAYNISRVILPTAGSSRFLAPDNFVRRWVISQPFPLKNYALKQPLTSSVIHYQFTEDEKDITGKDKNFQPLKLAAKADIGQPGKISIDKLFPHIRYSAFYAVAYLESPKPSSRLILYTGSSGYIKIWLNGRLVHTYNRRNRIGRRDQDVIRNIQLQRGRNRVVVKMIILNHPGDFYFRLGTANGLPLRFVPL